MHLLAPLAAVFLAAAEADAATNVTGNCPVGGFTAAGSPWNFTGGVAVPAGTTCTVQAGATLNGNGNALSVAAGGTLSAVGASAGNRNVNFNNVAVVFNAGSSGTVKFCTAQSTVLSYFVYLDGSQTVDTCTITAANASYGVFVANGSPTVSNNTISGPYVVYVQGGTPSITGNSLTALYAGVYYGAGAGTVSGNTIGFSGSSTLRYGLFANASASPVFDGNTILNDVAVNDIAISALVSTPGIDIINNTIHASGGDEVMEISPALFQAGSQISGNTFPTGLAAGIEIGGQVDGVATLTALTPAAGTTVSTYLVQNLSVPVNTTLVISAGLTLTGGGAAGSVNVSGTLTAVGSSTGNRNLVFHDVAVVFNTGSSGMVQYCTADSTLVSYFVYLQGSQTVDACTITVTSGSYAVFVASGSPTISNSAITGTYAVYVQSGTPSITGNTITASAAGIYYAGGGGTASANTIGFSGGSPPRYGVYASGPATPTIDGNTFLDDGTRNDIAVALLGTAAGADVINNTIHASQGDEVLQISPALFQAGSQVSGNTFPTGLAAGIEISGQLEGMATLAPLMPASGTTVSTYVVRNLTVPVNTTLTIAAGVTLTGGTTAGSISVNGTFSAIGASAGNRNVVFDEVAVVFNIGSSGTVQNCTAESSLLSYFVYLQGGQTLDSCTISVTSGSYAIFVASGAPTVSNNSTTGVYGIYVQSGAPAITNNAITATFAGIYYAAGAGTASGNTIGFTGQNANRYGVYVSGTATPMLNGNTILNDTDRNDFAISALVTAPGLKIIDNTIHASSGDEVMQISPALFQGSSQISGNVFPNGLAAGIEIGGQVEGTATLVPLMPAAGTTVSTFLLRNLTVPVNTTLTIAAGLTLTGAGVAGSVTVNGTINAVGASTGNRNVVFEDVAVIFNTGGAGTLQYCTASSALLSYFAYLQGAVTLDACTISVTSGSYALFVAGGSPTISNDTITGTYGIYVQAGSPSISGNGIWGQYAGIYYGAGGGTASANTIGFVGASSNRYGVYVAGEARPVLNANIIYDDPTQTDSGILVTAGTGNAMTQITNNMICTSGADTFIGLPMSFPGTVSGNVNSCGAITNTPTSTRTPTITRTPTRTRTTTQTSGATATPTYTPTRTATTGPSSTPALTNTVTPPYTATRTITATVPSTATPPNTATPLNTATPPSTATAPNTSTPTPTATATRTLTPTITQPPTATVTGTLPPTGTSTATPVNTATSPPSATSTLAPTSTATLPATATNTPTATGVPVATATPTSTLVPSPTPTATDTAVPPTVTFTATPTAMQSGTFIITGLLFGPSIPGGMTDELGRTRLKNERVDLFDCPTANFCLEYAPTLRQTTFTDDTGRFTFQVPLDLVKRKRYVLIQAIFGTVKCRFLLTPSDLRVRSGEFGGGSAAEDSELDIVIDPISEAASRILLEAGAENYSDESIASLRQLVIEANSQANFAGLTVEGANNQAETTAAAYAPVQTLIENDPRPPEPLECAGDCFVTGVVTVDNLVRGVRILHGDLAFEFCPEIDSDSSLDVSVGDLRDAVSRALGGCGP